jgi:hypothetical protein
MNNADDGATPVPKVLDQSCVTNNPDGSVTKRVHYKKWLWVDGVWTNRLKCSTCGEEFDADSGALLSDTEPV